MTHVEQKNCIGELREFERSMSRSEQEDFRMFVQRDKDDEDLDELAKKRLLELYTKFVVNRQRIHTKSPFDT